MLSFSNNSNRTGQTLLEACFAIALLALVSIAGSVTLHTMQVKSTLHTALLFGARQAGIRPDAWMDETKQFMQSQLAAPEKGLKLKAHSEGQQVSLTVPILCRFEKQTGLSCKHDLQFTLGVRPWY